MRPGPIIFLAPLLALGTACPPRGTYIWQDQYQSAHRAAEQGYVVTCGDLISVRVFNQDGMSAKVRVRADGRISLPFLGDVEAAGLAPVELSRRLQVRFKEFVVNPVVTVLLEEPRPLEVYVVGEVARPGRFPVDPKDSVLQAIAAAGGPTSFASEDRIFVVRREPLPVRIRFRLESLTRSVGQATPFRLRSGDTIVVE